jgi:hypothetical protein
VEQPEEQPVKSEKDQFIDRAMDNLRGVEIPEFNDDLLNVGGWLGKDPAQIIAWGMSEEKHTGGWEDFKAQCLKPKTVPVNHESYMHVVNAFFSEKFGRDTMAFQSGKDKEARKGIIPPEIMTGVEGKEGAAKVDVMFNNFNKIAFTYSPQHAVAALAGFMSRHGDCGTLANMFMTATQEAGIEGVKVEGEQKRRLVPAGKVHGAGTSNEMSGKYWAFGDHYWCVYNGTMYDLLFMKKGAEVPATYRYTASDEYKNCSYELYGDRAFISPEELKKLGVNPGKTQGMAFDSVKDLKQFIDTHQK